MEVGEDFADVAWRAPTRVDWGLCHNTRCGVRTSYAYAMGVAGERCACGHLYVSIGRVVQCW